MEAVPIEEPAQFLLRYLPHGQHLIAAVYPLKEKCFELFFSGSHSWGMGHDPEAATATRTQKSRAHFCSRVDRKSRQRCQAFNHKFRHLKLDQLVQHCATQFNTHQRAVAVASSRSSFRNQGNLEQFLKRNQAQLDGVIGIVGVVGDGIGSVDHLCLEQRWQALATALARGLRFQNLAGKIQARKLRIASFQQLHDAQRLRVVVEPPRAVEPLGERVFASVAERRVPDVVRQSERFNEIFIEGQRPAKCACDACHFQRVRESAAVVVAGITGEDLRFMRETSKGSRMDDPIAVTLIRTAKGMGHLLMHAAGGIDAVHGPGRKHEGFSGFPVAGECGRSHGNLL